jgi:4-hydroxy-2-oxoheptanedioate aldolase
MNSPAHPLQPHHPHHPLDTRLPALLAGPRRLRAIFNTLPAPAIVEMCAWAGFDFIVLDNEHGSAGLGTTEHLLRAARASGLPAIVRCFEADIARVLDMGASGVQVPMVESAEQAARLAARLRYPTPGDLSGRRGSAFSTRAAGYGAFGGPAHTRLSNEGLVFVPMVETPAGVAAAAEIAAVPGVHAVFVGPNDLAHTMGFENRWQEAPVQQAIEQVLRATAAAGKCPGVLALSAADEERYAAWGARYFANVTTGLITQALRQAAQGGAAGTRY